ncbi:MAG: S8 family serine peptidase [Wenzhouxiangella sp.]
MTSRFFSLSLAAVCALAITSTALAQQGFRVATEQLEQHRLALPAESQQDFGQWQWLTGDERLAAALTEAGIAFEHFPEAGQIQVHQHRFDPLIQWPASRNAPRDDRGQLLGLVQFHGPIRRSDLGDIVGAGLEPLQYYPHNAYLVWGEQQALNALAQRGNVRFAGEFAADWRVHQGLRSFTGTIRNINLHVVNSGDVRDLLRRVEATGAQVLDAWSAQPDGRLWDIKITLDATRLDSLMGLPELISANFMSPEVFFDDESGAQVVAGNLNEANQPVPGYMDWLGDINLTGAGVIWSVTDSGIWYGHGDYAGRIVGGANYPGCNFANPGDERVSGGGHGTHVAGIIGGDGAAGFTDGDGFKYGLGVAPDVLLFAQNPICGTQNSWPPAGGWPVLSRDAVRNNAIGSNNSWTSGEGTANGYQNTERTYDLMVLDGDFETPDMEPFIVVFSAGNSGPGTSTLTAPKEAKNPIVTASTQTFRVSGNVNTVSNFSSRGPAVDGRISPTIGAPGQTVSSTIKPSPSSCTTIIGGTNNQYSFCSGTSMAAPHASGALVLLAEWWRGFNDGQDFSPAMAKALLVSGARRIDTNPGPNFDVGFGMVDLSSLLSNGQITEFWDQTDLLTESGQQWQRQVMPADPSQPVRITLSWSDAPGAIGANPALVNDLDLIVDNNGEIWRGNEFEGPGGFADRLNNIEQVQLPATNGPITITVDAFQIAGSVLLDDPDAGPAQHFALVCENCTESADFGLILNPGNLAVCLPDSIDTEVNVISIGGFDEAVSLEVAPLPPGVLANLDETTVNAPGSTTLAIQLDDSLSPGDLTFRIDGTASTGTRSATGLLQLFNQQPDAVTLDFPPDQASDIQTSAVFSWQPVAQAAIYRLEVATDASFTNLVASLETSQTEASVNGLETATAYFYRVLVDNACGQSASPVFSFTTEVAPGDCRLDELTLDLMREDFEQGLPAGWQISGQAPTWAANDNHSVVGNLSMHAVNSPTVSDQRLETQDHALPDNASGLFLDFWNRQLLESRSAGGCWDGGILEYSSDAGANWTQVDATMLINRNYDGTIASGFGNPLTGLQAWCGDPRDWERYIVDLDSLAGQNVRFRFRLGTDNTVGREGWYIDDVRIRACVSGGLLQDRFEANDQ